MQKKKFDLKILILEIQRASFLYLDTTGLRFHFLTVSNYFPQATWDSYVAFTQKMYDLSDALMLIPLAYNTANTLQRN